MHELFEELKNIRKHYAAAQYPKAYHELHSLCRDYPECAEFSSAADSILSRYSDLEQSIMHGHLSLSQQEDRKAEIRLSYDTLMEKMKRLLKGEELSCYEKQVLYMRRNLTILKDTLRSIDEEIELCMNEAKRNALWNIQEHLSKVVRYFVELIKNYTSIQSYE